MQNRKSLSTPNKSIEPKQFVQQSSENTPRNKLKENAIQNHLYQTFVGRHLSRIKTRSEYPKEKVMLQ